MVANTSHVQWRHYQLLSGTHDDSPFLSAHRSCQGLIDEIRADRRHRFHRGGERDGRGQGTEMRQKSQKILSIIEQSWASKHNMDVVTRND